LEIKEGIMKRQSIRNYKNNIIEDEDILELVTLASKAPSAMNIQNWHYIAIKNSELKQKIADVIKTKNEEIASIVEKQDMKEAESFRKFCKNFTIFATKATVLIIVMSNEHVPMEKNIYELAKVHDATQKIHDLMYVKNPGMQGLGAGINTLMLSAVEKGYGTGWLSSANFASEEIEDLLKSEIGYEKKDSFMAAMLALGIPEDKQKSPGRKSVEEILTIVN
jgi:nitroreductase